MANEPSIASSDFVNFFGVNPSDQNALDVFNGEWSTRLPDSTGLHASAGPARLCEDYRIDWLESQMGSFAGKHVLELGPMEGGHAYMMEKKGAEKILSIEANARAYLKCLIMKEIFSLSRTRFRLGDFLEHLKATNDIYDLCVACGVFYHLTNPVEALNLIAQRSKSVFLWTVYYDKAFLSANPEVGKYFGPAKKHSVGGFDHTLHPKSYGAAKEWKGFCGGDKDASWMELEEIRRALQHFGFTIKAEVLESNPNSPAVYFYAVKNG